MRNLHGSFQSMAKMKGLRFDLRIDPAIPLILIGDATRLRQVLINLVQNAIKFTPAGRVEMSADVQSEDHSHAFIRFTITDTGIGIRAAEEGTAQSQDRGQPSAQRILHPVRHAGPEEILCTRGEP